MLPLKLPFDPSSSPRILCLGAHSDDIEIGCGGTILRLRQEYPSALFHWVVFSAEGVRASEAQQAASLFAGERIVGQPALHSFQDGFMPYHGAEIKTAFEKLKSEISPDLVFTHFRRDAHQDHRLLSELTANTFRNHLIFEYEIPKYDGDLGQPSVFVPLSEKNYSQKVDHLMNSFASQQTKRWFCRETFLALMRLRGMECNAPSGYAEAFYCHKVAL